MGVASLVLGIISIVLAFIPCLNLFAFLPSITGLILGIVGCIVTPEKNQSIGQAVAGIVLNSVAIVIIFIMFFLFFCVINVSSSFKSDNTRINNTHMRYSADGKDTVIYIKANGIDTEISIK